MGGQGGFSSTQTFHLPGDLDRGEEAGYHMNLLTIHGQNQDSKNGTTSANFH